MASAVGDVVDGDQQIGDVLDLAAVAEFADVIDLAAEVAEHRAQLPDQCGIAAGVENEIARDGLRAGAAHRRVEHRVPGLGQHARGLLLVGDGEGAHLDEHHALELGCGNFAHRIHQGLRLGQAGENGRRGSGDIDGVAGDLDAGAGRFAAARGADVVADHAPAGPAQIFGEGAAHDAEADDADRALGFLRPSHSNFPMVKMRVGNVAPSCGVIVIARVTVEWAYGCNAAFKPSRNRLSSQTKAVREDLCRSELRVSAPWAAMSPCG